MKPMLAVQVEVAAIQFPVYASPKLDGIRGLVIDGVLKSRSLKPIPNPFTTALFSRPELNGYDGELIVGSPTAKNVCNVTTGGMARHDGEPDVTFYVFDKFDAAGGFSARLESLRLDWMKHSCERVVVLEQRLIRTEAELLAYETEKLEQGYEGLILRDPVGGYKHGRSTVREGGMLKVKRFTDSEAEIIEVVEEMQNTNEKVTNELGRGQRSTSKDGLVPKGRAGALKVRDIHSGVVFCMAAGNNDDREFFWVNRAHVPGKIVKYKSFLIGVKDAPRFPILLGGRESWDM